MNRKQRQALYELLSGVKEHLDQLVDADEHKHSDTGEPLQDVVDLRQAYEHALEVAKALPSNGRHIILMLTWGDLRPRAAPISAGLMDVRSKSQDIIHLSSAITLRNPSDPPWKFRVLSCRTEYIWQLNDPLVVEGASATSICKALDECDDPHNKEMLRMMLAAAQDY